jgi:hypothetical protein
MINSQEPKGKETKLAEYMYVCNAIETGMMRSTTQMVDRTMEHGVAGRELEAEGQKAKLERGVESVR